MTFIARVVQPRLRFVPLACNRGGLARAAALLAAPRGQKVRGTFSRVCFQVSRMKSWNVDIHMPVTNFRSIGTLPEGRQLERGDFRGAAEKRIH